MKLTEEEKQDLKRKVDFLLENAEYQFAKTMPETPHHYTLKRKWGKNERFFNNVAHFVRQYGEKEKFYNRTFTYYYLGEYKYWVMDANPSDAILINRAKI